MTLVFIQIRAREAIQFDFPKMKQKSKYKITVKFFKKKKMVGKCHKKTGTVM